MKLKKWIFYCSLFLIASVLLSSAVYAATWEYKFPIIITDTSGADRAYLGVVLGDFGQNLIDSAKINADGLDTNAQSSATNIKYMLSTTYCTGVVPNLPASGKSTIDLYTGYSPEQTGFPIITGKGGYITFTEGAALEPGAAFSFNTTAYINTDSSGDSILYKKEALAISADSTTSGKINVLEYPNIGQPIIGTTLDTLNGAATEYNCLMGAGDWNATENLRAEVMPTAGVLSVLSVKLVTAPGAGTSYAFTVMKNGVATALTCTIANTSTTGSDSTHTVSFVAGDTVSVKCVTSGAATASIASWSTFFTPTVLGQTVFLCNVPANTAATVYGLVQGNMASQTTEAYMQAAVPTAGVFSKMYVSLSTDPGTSPDEYDIAFLANGVAKMAVNVIADATTGSDLSNTYTATAGDLIDIRIQPISTPSATPNIAIGFIFTPTTSGQSVIICAPSDQPSNAAIRYAPLNSVSGGTVAQWTATETNTYTINPGLGLISKMYVNLGVAPGAGTSYQFKLRANGADSGLDVTVANAATTGSDTTHTCSSPSFSNLDVSSQPTGAPAATYARISFLISHNINLASILGIASGEYPIGLSLSGGTLLFDVGGTTNSTAFAGSMPNSSFNFIIGSMGSYYNDIQYYVSGTRKVYYAPTVMLTGTTLPDREGADNDGTITWGTNTDLTVSFGEMQSYTSYVATGNLTAGFTMPNASMPATWFSSGESIAGLPFYAYINSMATSAGIPTKTVYIWIIIGLGFCAFTSVILYTKSAFMAVMSMAIVFFIGSSMTIMPMWIPFVILLVDFGIMYLIRQVSY